MNFNDSSGQQPDDNGDATQIINAYTAILAITDQMLQAAKNNDWDELITLEHNCKRLANQLMEQPVRKILSEVQQKKKIDLIQQILARDAEIRTITEPKMAHLQNILTNCDHKRKLKQTYRTDR